MEIGDWKATEGLNEIVRKAREHGLESNLFELEAFGFTVVPPYKAAPKEFIDRLRDAAFRVAENDDQSALDPNAIASPVYGRQLFHLLPEDPVFAEAMMNPFTLTFGRYMLGMSCRLYTTVIFFKNGKVGCTNLHCDSTGMPPPLPRYGNVCNVSWVLTDYTVETGTLYIVPGSHRHCRHPTTLEQPAFMGGPAPNDLGTPVLAEPGSMIVFHGNTWHGSLPKTDPGPRVAVSFGFCRNYVNPAETYDDAPEVIDRMIERFGREAAALLERESWQRYGKQGPKFEHMAKVLPANWNQHA